jgi:hypothetical protein
VSSRREQVLEALKALVQAAAPNATVQRNQEFPQHPDPGGTFILRDGLPGEPTIDLSPPRYNYEHRVPLDVLGFLSATRSKEQVLDALLTPIGAAVAADRTLGGLVDFLDLEAPVADDLDVAAGRFAEVAFLASYATDTPLT